MPTVLALALLTLSAAADAHYPDAVTVYACDFDASYDKNFDAWPDNWTRRRGIGFPHYVRMEIVPEGSPRCTPCLQVTMDGGGATAFSPPIPVSNLFGYVLEVDVLTRGLKYDSAFLSLTALDADHQKLETRYSETTRSDEWTRLRLGPVSDLRNDTRYLVIGLHVEPSGHYDLNGEAFFSGVWLARLPRVELTSSAPYNLFSRASEVEVKCRISGVVEDQPKLRLALVDGLGQTIEEKNIAPQYAPAPREIEEAAEKPTASLLAVETWRPPIPGPGFYRICAVAKGHGVLSHERALTLAVLEPGRADPASEFGWTLPHGQEPMDMLSLQQLLGQAGIHWVKFPLWCDAANNPAALEPIVNFAERLAAQDIELVGLLNRPPPTVLERFGSLQNPSAAAIFSLDTKIWYPTLEPLLTRMATQVRWWQLGDDLDTSFHDFVDLRDKVDEVKAELDRIGQDINLGFGWNWICAVPGNPKGNPWKFLALSTDPVLTPQELGAYLDGPRGDGSRRWVVIEPLDDREYDVSTRVRDLVERIVAAKIHEADAIFCPDPFKEHRGLMNADGTPGDLFYPWRTAALLLGGAHYLGSLQLPGGSTNHVFVRGNAAVLVAWNDHPCDELLYLGKHARRVDLFGRSESLEADAMQQTLRVGPLPTFFTGTSASLARWQMGAHLDHERIPSAFGRPQANALVIHNPFDRGASGKVTIRAPEGWIADPVQSVFRLAEDEELKLPFALTLPYSASSGSHRLRFDFDVQADQSYQFSVYRTLEVGLGDVYIEISSYVNSNGELEVVQRFVNDTDGKVNFRCELYAPERRRLRSQILNQPRGQDVKTYRLERGDQLVGRELWLRASEIDGPRILNYRFTGQR